MAQAALSGEQASATDSAGPRRSNVAGVVAALLPFVGAAYALGTLAVALDGPMRLFQALTIAAPFGFAVVGSVSACALLVGGCLFVMAGRGTGVPAAVPLGLATGPWLLGLLGGAHSFANIDGALPYAAPEQRLRLAAQGLAESHLSPSFGAWCSGALLTATAIALAIGASARRGEGRSASLAALGVLGLVAPGIAFAFLPATTLAIPSTLAPAIAVAIAGASIGRDGRSGAQASAAALAAAFALAAVALGWTGLGTYDGLTIFAHGDRARHAVGLGIAFTARGAGRWLLAAGAGGAALAALAIAVIAAGRARPTIARVLGGVVAVAMLAVVAAAHALGSRQLDSLVDASRPWDEVEGFTPITTAGRDFGGAVHAIVTPERVIAGGRDPIAIDDDAGIAALLAGLRAPPRSFLPDIDEPPSVTTLRLAIDARVPAPALVRLVRIATDAGFGALTIVGEGEAPSGLEAVAHDRVIAALARGPTIGTTVELARASEREDAEQDPLLWHAVVGAGDVMLARRAPAAPVPLDEAELSHDDVVYLAVDPSAPIARVVAIADRVRARDASPVLVAGAIPGRPERPLGEASAPDAALGSFRVVRGRAQLGALEDEAGTGLFDSTLVTRMLRRRMAPIQRCYELLLRASPTLGGRVVVRFTIEPIGTVTGVTVTASSGEPRLDQCVTTTIARLRFNPGPEGGSVTYSYPFELTPQP